MSVLSRFIPNIGIRPRRPPARDTSRVLSNTLAGVGCNKKLSACERKIFTFYGGRPGPHCSSGKLALIRSRVDLTDASIALHRAYRLKASSAARGT